MNVPYRLVDDARFVEGIGDLLDESQVDAGRLTLEIVPAGPGAGSALDDEVIARLRELGVRISLDDGGRAASFAALRTLPLDELKIDTGFVHGLGRVHDDAAVRRDVRANGGAQFDHLRRECAHGGDERIPHDA